MGIGGHLSLSQSLQSPLIEENHLPMTTQEPSSSTPLLHRLFDDGALAGLTDADLIDRYIARRDPAAFAALVARHGAMVLAVCRGVAGTAGGDDAFQATWLLFFHRIGTFPSPSRSEGGCTASPRRVARQARTADARRRQREAIATTRRPSAPAADPDQVEIRTLIRQEVAHLPELYRIPITLCDLEGLTRDEAAALLGCPPGTIGGRVARGRQRLRARLERRGIAPTLAWAAPGASAPWQTSLAAATRTAATRVADPTAHSTAAATTLAATASRTMLTTPIRTALAVVLVPCYHGRSHDRSPPTRAASARAGSPAHSPDPAGSGGSPRRARPRRPPSSPATSSAASSGQTANHSAAPRSTSER